MNNPIYPCFWFDGNAKAAAEFYCSVFKNPKITADTPMVVNFTGSQAGNAEHAMNFYASIFSDSKIKDINRYVEGEHDVVGTVKHGRFNLSNQSFVAMDSSAPHGFQFNEAISFVVDCETQEEIDYYWNKLTEGGQESQCGWLKDKFGVSWQIVPTILGKLMADPSKTQRVVAAFMKMKKFDIEKLVNA